MCEYLIKCGKYVSYFLYWIQIKIKRLIIKRYSQYVLYKVSVYKK